MNRLLVGIALAVSVASCNDSTAVTPEAELAGTYTLQTVNGSPLPYIFDQEGPGNRLEITAGSLVLNSNRTFTTALTIRVIVNNAVVTTIPESGQGTFTRANAVVTLIYADGSTEVGTYSNNTLTVVTSDEVPATLVLKR